MYLIVHDGVKVKSNVILGRGLEVLRDLGALGPAHHLAHGPALPGQPVPARHAYSQIRRKRGVSDCRRSQQGNVRQIKKRELQQERT